MVFDRIHSSASRRWLKRLGRLRAPVSLTWLGLSQMLRRVGLLSAP